MIVCDGKHDKQVPASSAIRVRGDAMLGKEAAKFDLRLSIPGKQYCNDCMIEKAKGLDLPALLSKPAE